jgi:predicted metal-binding transcription factor (methanogenesis marker protein 9)
MTLKNMGMSHDEYLDLKKELSERLVGVKKPAPDEKAEALAETFNISKLEAMNVLTECNNDLRAAVKVLHAKSLEESD